MLFHDFINLLHGAVGGSSPGDKHNVITNFLRKTRQKEAVSLPDDSTCPVAVVRFTDLFTGGNSNAIKAISVFCHIGHQRGADCTLFPVKFSEFMVLVQRDCLLQHRKPFRMPSFLKRKTEIKVTLTNGVTLTH